MKRLLPVLVIAWMLALTAVASAVSPYGHWRTSGGNTIHITAKSNGHLNLHFAGKDVSFDAVWDAPGKSFHYKDQHGITRCVIKNGNLIAAYIDGRSPPHEWVRIDSK